MFFFASARATTLVPSLAPLLLAIPSVVLEIAPSLFVCVLWCYGACTASLVLSLAPLVLAIPSEVLETLVLSLAPLLLAIP